MHSSSFILVIADKKSARTVKAIERSYSEVRVVFELGRCLDPIDMEEKRGSKRMLDMDKNWRD